MPVNFLFSSRMRGVHGAGFMYNFVFFKNEEVLSNLFQLADFTISYQKEHFHSQIMQGDTKTFNDYFLFLIL